MSRQHFPTPFASFVAGLLALACLGMLAGGCSNKSGSAPSGSTGGPALNFAFPATGVSHQFTFTAVGSWGYHCIAHGAGGMTGTIIVDPNSTVDSLPVGQ